MKKKQSTYELFSRYSLTALSATGTLLILGWLLEYCSYGYEFTDESFYLAVINNPFMYDWTVTQFGFIYHPLYSILGGNIENLRQVNVFITFCLAWSLTYFFLISLVPTLKKSYIQVVTIAGGFATSSLILFQSGYFTPSYNSLTLQALLISSFGLFLIGNPSGRLSVIGCIIVGVGGWLTFMAKPSSAFALAIVFFFSLLFAHKISIWKILLAATCALGLLIISAIMIDGSVQGFYERLSIASGFFKHLEQGHSLRASLRVDNFYLNTNSKFALFVLSAVMLVGLLCVKAKNQKWLLINFLISLGFFLVIALLVFYEQKYVIDFGTFQGLLIFSVIYPAAFLGAVLNRGKLLKTISIPEWTIALTCFVMPHVFAFGSNGNYWQLGHRAAFFWLLAGLIFIGLLVRERSSWLIALPLAFGTQFVTAIMLQSGFENPYRQDQPLRLNESRLAVGPVDSILVLSSGYANYIASAVSVAQNAMFKPFTPVIDLTGQSPGLLFAMKAKGIGHPWNLGGFSGSEAFVKAGLAHFTCDDISKGWILTETEGPRKIPTNVLVELGADFPNSYVSVGKWQTAAGAGGYLERRTQEFYKPVAPEKTMETCQKLRQEE